MYGRYVTVAPTVSGQAEAPRYSQVERAQRPAVHVGVEAGGGDVHLRVARARAHAHGAQGQHGRAHAVARDQRHSALADILLSQPLDRSPRV